MTLMRTIARLALSGAALSGAALTLVPGCTSSDPVVEEPLSSETGFCEALAEAVCSANVVDACYGSAASTVDEDTRNCRTNAADKFCNPDNLVYRSPNAQLCIDAQAAAYADAKIEVAELDAIDAACHANLSGNAGKKDACELDSDCNGEAGLRCVIKIGDPSGLCQAVNEVGPGLDCGGSADICEDGFYCNEDSSCIAEQSAGEDCSDLEPCDDESLCVSDVCVAKFSNGSDCNSNEECTGGFCDIPDGGSQGSCKASLPLGTSNGTCDGFLP